MFEKDNELVTKVDLPGMKKEDVKVEVMDGHLAVSGERKSETEETKDSVYRCERDYGSFYRARPFAGGGEDRRHQGVLSDGVLEVSGPLPAKAEAKAHKVEIRGNEAGHTRSVTRKDA